MMSEIKDYRYVVGLISNISTSCSNMAFDEDLYQFGSLIDTATDAMFNIGVCVEKMKQKDCSTIDTLRSLHSTLQQSPELDDIATLEVTRVLCALEDIIGEMEEK